MADDRIQHPDSDHDPHQEEVDVPDGINPPSKQLEAALKDMWLQFQAGIEKQQDFGQLEYDLYLLHEGYLQDPSPETEHAFVVDMLETLNRYREPLTARLMKKYGIANFTLTFEDFDRICLDFLNAKHGERMIIDPDSVPEELEGLPMSIDEIGDSLRGELRKTETGRWYLAGKNDRWFPLAKQDLSDEELGKSVSAVIRDGKAHEYIVLA